MEFYQFHPTALFLPGVSRFLLSEALRGEGAYLRNAQGERFMERYHPLLELAPRDVVARAITTEAMPQHLSQAKPVYLDMRHVAQEHPSLDLSARFPGISAFLSQHNLRLDRDLIPIRPAAHYLMGGVATDTFARTSLPGLYAAGEVACTGVHGANRLASNSLLEGLVFGARAAESMLAEESASATPSVPYSGDYEANAPTAPQPFDIPAARATLQAAMWRDAGLLRDRDGLQRASALIADLQLQRPASTDTREAVELRNLLDVVSLIVHFALFREESRGAPLPPRLLPHPRRPLAPLHGGERQPARCVAVCRRRRDRAGRNSRRRPTPRQQRRRSGVRCRILTTPGAPVMNRPTVHAWEVAPRATRSPQPVWTASTFAAQKMV